MTIPANLNHVVDRVRKPSWVASDAPNWLQTLVADLEQVTRGAFRVEVIGLRQDQVERVEKWARKQVAHAVKHSVKASMVAEGQKVTGFALRDRSTAVLNGLHWTHYGTTPIRIINK